MALTTLGIRDFYVKKKPKIIFFGTGNEIVDYNRKIYQIGKFVIQIFS